MYVYSMYIYGIGSRNSNMHSKATPNSENKTLPFISSSFVAVS